mgnify:CR=1 FL=1
MPKKQTTHKKTKNPWVNRSIVFGSVLLLGLVSFQTIITKTSIGNNKSASATSYTRIWTNRSSTTVSACNGYSDGRYFLKVYGTKSTSRVMNVRLFRIKNGSHFLGPYHRWGNPATYFYSRSSSAGSVKFILNTPIGSPSVQRTIPFTSITAC